MSEDARNEEARVIEDARRWAESRRADLAKRAWNFAEKKENREALAALDPTALRTMLGAAANASCLREIEILLRYQHGRDRVKWSKELVAGIEAELEQSIASAKKDQGELPPAVSDAGEAMIAASWLGFLVRLHRYHYEAAREQRGGRR